MVARFTGAALGLLAFAVTALAGLYSGNPVSTTLSRSILALFCFCVIGLVVGAAAQAVVAEHQRNGELRSGNQKHVAADAADASQTVGETASAGQPTAVAKGALG